LSWRNGKVTEAVIHSVGGLNTKVVADGKTRTVRLTRGKAVTLRW
jgi:alpha-L-fucosidase 2